MTTGPRRRPRPRAPWYDSPWRIAGTAAGTALTVAAVGLVLALVAVPRLVGGAALTVLSGSMEPALAPGDVVVTRGVASRDVCAEVGVGDIVTYLPRPDDPALVTHRVVGKTIGTFDDGTGCRLLTQGDANTAVDDPVSPDQVRGVFLYGLPRLGWVRQWATQHPQLLAALVALAVLGSAVVTSRARPRTRTTVIPAPAWGDATEGAPVVGAREQAAREQAAREQGLRERELLLRERELVLRERELALRLDPLHPATSEE